MTRKRANLSVKTLARRLNAARALKGSLAHSNFCGIAKKQLGGTAKKGQVTTLIEDHEGFEQARLPRFVDCSYNAALACCFLAVMEYFARY
jgi:hypothetical protein